MANVIVRLKQSTIEAIPRHKKTVIGLGLRRLGQERTLLDTPEVRGMIQSVCHLVEVIEKARPANKKGKGVEREAE